MGLLLFSHSLAGLSLEPGHAFKFFGISLRLTHSQLLPYILPAVAIYGLLRYYYYFILLTKTPYAVRQNLLNKLVHHIHLKDGPRLCSFVPLAFILARPNLNSGHSVHGCTSVIAKQGNQNHGMTNQELGQSRKMRMVFPLCRRKGWHFRRTCRCYSRLSLVVEFGQGGIMSLLNNPCRFDSTF